MIPGLSVLDEWITTDEERDLLLAVGDGGPPRPGAGAARNRIERFGSWDTGYGVGHRYEEEIPSHFAPFMGRLANDGALEPDSITVNWYQPGQGIAPHIDRADAGDVIAVLSIGSDATMQFARSSGRYVQRIRCARRALLVMRDEARWLWRHSVLPVADHRISIVFRRAA